MPKSEQEKQALNVQEISGKCEHANCLSRELETMNVQENSGKLKKFRKM